MKHQAAYSLLWLAGKEPTQKDVEAYMAKCGVSVDKEALGHFFKCMEGKNVVDAVKAGAAKQVAMPRGGGGGGGAAAASGAAGAPAAAEEKAEEKAEEEEDVDMG